jgi:GTP-binding protein Era
MFKLLPNNVCRPLPSCTFAFRCLRNKPKRKMPIPSYDKRLDIAIIGQPNVGKSVLLNCLVKQKIAAATRKKHTTRSNIVGVFNHRNIQLVFYDTPGFVRQIDAQKADIKALRTMSTTMASKADVVLIVVDASKRLRPQDQDTFVEMVKIARAGSKEEVILILNKVDLVEPKGLLLDLVDSYVSLINGVKLTEAEANQAQLDTTTFMISGQDNDGVIDLKNYLISLSKFKPWLIPRGSVVRTTLTHEERVEEIMLEKLLENVHEEIPYICDIQCRPIIQTDSNTLRIDVDIRVDTEGQKKIILGQQGRSVVKIRQDAVEDLEKIFVGKQILLFIWVELRGKR